MDEVIQVAWAVAVVLRAAVPLVREVGRLLALWRRRRYVAGMDRLTPDQARKILDSIGPTTGYLWRMLGRMDATNLRLADPKLYGLVVAARDAMHSLTVELHYQSCAGGVGRPAGQA